MVGVVVVLVVAVAFADEVELVAVFAFYDFVFFGEGGPMLLLLRGEDAAALAERADVVHSGQDGVADKSGGVWEPTDCLGELGVGLESDDFLLHRGRSVAGFGAEGNTGWRGCFGKSTARA